MGQPSAIIVVAYNRAGSLRRLLQSLENAIYKRNDIPLIISIDKADNKEVHQVANEFVWNYGVKNVVMQEERLGLRKHILQCGDYSIKYGSAIILEDDITVSPAFYQYADAAHGFYKDEGKVVGVSLYGYSISESRLAPFYAVNDGYCNYFMQVPSSWGQLFIGARWAEFKEWYNRSYQNFDEKLLPAYIRNWGEKSWKRIFAAYMIESNKFFVFPHVSYSTNYGDYGENTDRSGVFQVPMAMEYGGAAFSPIQISGSVYDASFEISSDILNRYVPQLAEWNYTVDLYGSKTLGEVKTPYLLSSKKCAQPLLSFGNNLSDAVQSVIFKDKGTFFSLGPTTSFVDGEVELSDFYNGVTGLISPYPGICFVVMAQNSGMLDNTLQSIARQNYPNIEICVIPCATDGINSAAYYKTFAETMHASRARYFTVMYEGEELLDGACQVIRGVANCFPGIRWFTGIQAVTTDSGYKVVNGQAAHYRWSQKSFQNNIYGSSGRYIAPGSTVFSKSLWADCRGQINFVSEESFFDDLCTAFFKQSDLYTVSAYMSARPYGSQNRYFSYLLNLKRAEKSPRLRERIMQYCFLNNIPLLRSFYRLYYELPHVIRYNYQSKTYNLSEF